MNEELFGFGVCIEHLEGSKFMSVGTVDSYEVNGSNIVNALNVVLANYGLKINFMDGVDEDDIL